MSQVVSSESPIEPARPTGAPAPAATAPALPKAAAARVHTIILPSRGWAGVDLRELWQSRDLLLSLAVRDLKVRYKQTALGVIWVVFQPLAAAAIFMFVFGRVLNVDTPDGVPYLPFAFAGIAAWGLISQIIARAGQSMVGNAHMISKIYFPRLLLPGATVLSTLADFAVSLVVLVGLVAVLWHPPGLALLVAPVCLLLMVMLALGIGLIATALAVSYRDVQQILPVLVQLLFFASPIVYDVEKLLDHGDGEPIPGYVMTLYMLNPVAPLVQTWRWSVLGVGEPYWGYFAYAAAAAVVMLLMGVVVFRRMERTFADVV